MKVPELYVGDIMLLVQLLDKHTDEIDRRAKQIMRRAKIRHLIWPFSGSDYYAMRAIEMNVLLAKLRCMSELANKLMSSTGIDDDGKHVSFADVIEKHKQQAN